MMWLTFITQIVPYLTAPMTWITFLVGACIGSFLNVCILRIPEKTFFKNQRSVCPACNAGIPFYLNIPILSWFILRGKAACCGAKLSKMYPLVELLTAVVFVVFYWKYPFISMSAGVLQWDPANVSRFGHGVIFASLLIVCSGIDFRLMIIPDVISLPMIAVTPFVVWIHPDLDWLSAAIGVLAGGGSLYAIAWLYYLVRHEVGMGMGDVKLLAAIGGWLGYQAIIPTIFYGSLLGALSGIAVILIARKLSLKSAIPFGPFLAIGAIIHLIIGPYLQKLLLY